MKKEPLNELLDSGAEIIANIAGAIVGGILIGPGGVLAGASIPTILKKGFKWIGEDVLNRNISKREEQKIGAGYTFALLRIEKNIKAGREYRNDGFIDNENILSDSNSILEGITVKLQKEWELKKLQFYGNLLGNISFEKEIHFNYATVLLKLAETLSYRQLCLIKVFENKGTPQIDLSPIDNAYRKSNDLRGFNYSLYVDLVEMEQLSVLKRSGAITVGATIGSCILSDIGIMLYRLMNLDELDIEDYNRTLYDLQDMLPKML